MPKLLIFETRQLVLPLETVVDALLELDRERGGRLALSSITDARIGAGGCKYQGAAEAFRPTRPPGRPPPRKKLTLRQPTAPELSR